MANGGVDEHHLRHERARQDLEATIKTVRRYYWSILTMAVSFLASLVVLAWFCRGSEPQYSLHLVTTKKRNRLPFTVVRQGLGPAKQRR